MQVLTVKKASRHSALILIIVALTTGGCSSVPDAANPVEWYKGTRDWVTGAEKNVVPTNEASAKPLPGGDKAFPKLNSVPTRPQRTTAAERENLAESLVADRDAARYTNDQIRRQETSVANAAPQRPAPPVQVAQSLPTPPVPPVRTRPVVRQEIVPPIPAPTANSVASLPSIPNVPVPVSPSRPPSSVGVPRPQQVSRAPVAPALVPPPPPPVIVGSATQVPDPFSSAPQNARQLPPVVNPSGGGSVFGQSAPPVQENSGFIEADRFASQFQNDADLAQRPTLNAPVIETAQALPPESAPVATILFSDGSARVGAGDRQVIRNIYNEYRARGGRIHVVGHASSRTRNLDQASHQLANFSISYERARAVAAVLERLGMPPEAIILTAMSDQQPNYFEVMPAGEAGNRRVEVFFEN